jgi:hypothetical protein
MFPLLKSPSLWYWVWRPLNCYKPVLETALVILIPPVQKTFYSKTLLSLALCSGLTGWADPVKTQSFHTILVLGHVSFRTELSHNLQPILSQSQGSA